MKAVFLTGVPLLFILALGLLVLVGPWPTYSASFEGKPYYEKALDTIKADSTTFSLTLKPGPLQAGWAKRSITPTKPGVPLAGYGARHGAPSEGVHDDIYVKALALNDGADTVVFVGADMLIMPENVAELVRKDVSQRTPLTANNLYFAASHTHSGVGGFGPGIAAYAIGGKYDPDIPPFLAKAFADAIVEAYEKLEPAKLAHGGVDAKQYIRNRTRNAPVDPELSYLLVEQNDGDRCFMVSFSAHPTNLGEDNMLFSAEYPGALQRTLEETGAFAVYLGGALGSMSPQAPEGTEGFERVDALGQALAELVLKDVQSPAFEANVDIAAMGVPLELPPFQLRLLSPKWRLSKFVGPMVGIDDDGWMEGARVDGMLFVGVPADFSGEISVKWKETAAQQGFDLWTTSFSADYAGYVSPDQYYGEVKDEKGGIAYETGFMSWVGPHQEAYFTALKDHIVAALTGQNS